MSNARKAKGAYAKARPRGGPGATWKEDPFDNWRASISPPFRPVEVIRGERGGAQLVNPRGGALETRYRKGLISDDQFSAGVFVRNQIEKAHAGGRSTIFRVLVAAEVGEAALERRTPARTLTDAQADAMQELAWVHCKVGRTPYRVLQLFFADGLTLTDIDRKCGWPAKAQKAATYLDGALDDVAVALHARHKIGQNEACSPRSDSVESSQARKIASGR